VHGIRYSLTLHDQYGPESWATTTHMR
jgi:hypothetical protein